jgi:3-hydroxybutyryl-CoA dehydrogenase
MEKERIAGLKIGIAGAGTMGASMAQSFAKQGFEVNIYDLFEEGLSRGRQIIALNQETEVVKGEISQEESLKLMERISYSTSLEEAFSKVDFIVESIKEDLSIKQNFWKEVNEIASESCLFASNTSSLSITSIAKLMKNPERFCGMHWFNPAHLVPLVEVIKGEHTSNLTAEKVYQLALLVGKKPITVEKDIPGFVGNRLQSALFREAIALASEGVASYEDIDKAVKNGIGFRWACLGPFEIADQGGLDIWYKVSENLFQVIDNSHAPSGNLAELCGQGHYGLKTGKGFYNYESDTETAIKKRDELFTTLADVFHKEMSS